MNVATKNRIAAAIETVFDFIGGDSLTYYPPTWTATGTNRSSMPTKVRCIIQNTTNLSQVGVTVDEAGSRGEVSTEVLFLNRDLRAAGITLDPAGWFKDAAGVRWDFEKDKPILDKQVALGALHNVTAVQIRKAIELQLNESTASVSFILDD